MTTKTTWAVARVLRDRDAGLYLSGVVVSGFGTSALWLASGVWVKDLTGSDGLAALCVLAMWLPTLAGPLLGTLADRGRRRPLLIGVNVLLGALLLTLVGVDAPGDLWLLYAVLFVYGAAGVVHDAAESALVATAVDPSLLGDFNGLRMTATEGMKLLAPLAGAGLYAAHGGAGVALLDAATFVLAAGLYALLRVREEKPAQPTGSRRRRTAEGVRHLWAHPVLRPLVLAGGATMLCAGLNGAMVYAVVDGLGHSPRTPACSTPCRAPVRSRSACSAAPPCATWGRGASRRPASSCWLSRWHCGRCRPTPWRWCAARRSAWGCPRC